MLVISIKLIDLTFVLLKTYILTINIIMVCLSYADKRYHSDI